MRISQLGAVDAAMDIINDCESLTRYDRFRIVGLDRDGKECEGAAGMRFPQRLADDDLAEHMRGCEARLLDAIRDGLRGYALAARAFIEGCGVEYDYDEEAA